MIDRDPAHRAPPPDDLTDFAPVPRKVRRQDGWTAERQRGFIAALADLGSVRHAAHAVNMTPECAYLLRRHPEAEEFRAAWERAIALGVQRLEDVAMDRALNGVEVPVYAYGTIIGTRTVYNDALLMFLLRNRSNGRFTADVINPDTSSRAALERLKKQWRAEWERERAIRDHEDEDEVMASIEAKLDLMRERWLAAQEDEAREAAGEADDDPADDDFDAITRANGVPGNPGPEDSQRVPRRVEPPPLPAPFDAPRNEDEAYVAEWMRHVMGGGLGSLSSQKTLRSTASLMKLGLNSPAHAFSPIA